MRAGELHERVTIQRQSAGQDTYGADVTIWTDVATVWAAVEPLLGREFVEGRRLEAEVTTKIRMRRRDWVTPSMRVVHGTSTYNVVSVQHVRSERRELVLMCREVL